MNIEDLTIKEAREIANLFTGMQKTSYQQSSINYPIGKYVIVRTRNEGINFGKLEEADETGCVISEAQRIYYHKPKDKSTAWYEGVSQSGLSDDSKISCVTERKYILEDYSLTICTAPAITSIKSHKPHETS